MSGARYRVAQICLNGHPTNSSADINPERNQSFCQKCGAATIMKCETCNAPIRGTYDVPGVAAIGFKYISPSFCPNCGKAYPWTAMKLKAAEAICDMIDTLTDREKQELKESMNNLVHDNPYLLVSAVKFRSLILKAGPVMKAALWETISEAVDKKAAQLINS